MAKRTTRKARAKGKKAKASKAAVVAMSAGDRRTLAEACDRLEHPSLAARLTALIGRPVEEGLKLLPRRWYVRIHDATEATIARSLALAIRTLPGSALSSREDLHKILGISSGAVGGFFGLPGTLAELTVSTTLIMRSIADIARDVGEDLATVEGRLDCVEVFACGGRPTEDDAAVSG